MPSGSLNFHGARSSRNKAGFKKTITAPGSGRCSGTPLHHASGRLRCLWEKLSDFDAESSGDPHQVHGSDISFAALNSAVVGPVQANFVGECLLGKPTCLTNFANTVAQGDQLRLSAHAPRWRSPGTRLHGL